MISHYLLIHLDEIRSAVVKEFVAEVLEHQDRKLVAAADIHTVNRLAIVVVVVENELEIITADHQ